MDSTTVLADTSLNDVMQIVFERYLIIGGAALLAILLLGVLVLMFRKRN